MAIYWSKLLLSPTRIRPNWLTSVKRGTCQNAEGKEKGGQSATPGLKAYEPERRGKRIGGCMLLLKRIQL